MQEAGEGRAGRGMLRGAGRNPGMGSDSRSSPGGGLPPAAGLSSLLSSLKLLRRQSRGLPSRLPHTREPRSAVTARITEHLAAAEGTSQPCVPKHRLGGLGEACGGHPGDCRQWDAPWLL